MVFRVSSALADTPARSPVSFSKLSMMIRKLSLLSFTVLLSSVVTSPMSSKILLIDCSLSFPPSTLFNELVTPLMSEATELS